MQPKLIVKVTKKGRHVQDPDGAKHRAVPSHVFGLTSSTHAVVAACLYDQSSPKHSIASLARSCSLIFFPITVIVYLTHVFNRALAFFAL